MIVDTLKSHDIHNLKNIINVNDYIFECPILNDQIEEGFIVKSHETSNNLTCKPKYVLCDDALTGLLENNNRCYICRGSLKATDYIFINNIVEQSDEIKTNDD